MNPLRPMRWVAVMVAGVAALAAVTALAAANSVPATRVGQSDHPVTLQQLAPPECASIAGTLERLVVGTGNINGAHFNELILGGAGADTIGGGPGADCIVGGGGSDVIDGDQGTDVLLGGPDDDALNGGPQNDICYGGPGTDTAQNCETTFDIP